MPSLEVKGYSIDDITKGLGACAIGAYVLGYLVLSYHLSTFGFNSVSPFRPRVLETGVCTLIFFAVPMLIGSAAASISSRGMPHSFALLMRALCLPFFCSVISGAPGFIDDLPRSLSAYSIPGSRPFVIAIWCLTPVLVMGLMWLFFLALRWVWHNYHKRRFLSMLILIPISTCFMASGINPTKPPSQVRAFLWFLAFSLITCSFIGSEIEKVEERKRDHKILEAKQKEQEVDGIILDINGDAEREVLETDRKTDLLLRANTLKEWFPIHISEIRSETSRFRLERFLNTFSPLLAFVFSIFSIAVYTNWIFPFIPLKLGGGEIVAVTLYQSEASQSARPIHGGMLDESDQGFFILPSGHDKGLFIPKERVGAIYFADGPSDIDKAIK
jgi:hypothetical protein